MTNYFTIYDPLTGRILRSGSCSAEDLQNQVQLGESLLPITSDWGRHYVQNGVLVDRLPQPSSDHVFDWDTKVWHDPRTLVDMKALKSAEISLGRTLANQSSFVYTGKTIVCDALSRSDIDGVNGYVALYGTLPPNWTGGWKTLDNSYVPIASVDTWKAFYSAMVAAGSANFAHAQDLKAGLALAATLAEVEAIVW